MTREKRTKKAHRSGLVVGPILITRRGYGFVGAPDGDLYVARRDMAGAMHRDIVAVRPNPTRGHEGRSGSVARIVERANTTLVGTFERHGGIGIVVPSDPRLRTDVFVHLRDAQGATDGDIVVVRLTVYPGRATAAQGVVEEVLGTPDTPGIAIEVIIREHGLETEFTESAREQAAAIKLDVEAALASQPDRQDVRGWFTVTIDPVDARDFDDAITLERVDGRVRLGVHIADVSHYVGWDSAIDTDARRRATSVYLVDRVLPMLPEELSNGICSLNPGEDRLAFSVVMDLDDDAVVQSYRIFPSVLRSNRRFNYDEVETWLDGESPFPDEDSERVLREFARIASAIGRRRVARGGLDFETVEAKVRLAEDGKPIEVVLRERTQATNMIEEAMILANEVVAGHMARAKAPMVYRIHENPDPDALAQIAVILKEFNYPIKDVHGATPATFQKIIRFAHTRPEKLLINSLLLRAMERARYVDYLAPHFGLASPAYCHFTSPIRRYPDLIVHRLLKAQLRGRLEKDHDAAPMVPELEWLAEHSSVMEREAESAENDSVRYKLCELMAEHVGDVFPGIVTGVQSFGLFVQLENTAEGLVHVDTMADDYYRLEPERFLLAGEKRGRSFRLGQRVAVRILNVSVAESRIDFELA
jgi:ribonuclease R